MLINQYFTIQTSCSPCDSNSDILQISYRKMDRVKRRFVEAGLDIAPGGRQGRRKRYERKVDGEFEARLVALSCSQPRWSGAGCLPVSLRL